MISAGPSLSVLSSSKHRPTGIESFVREYVDDYWFYGSGKAALRDGLAVLADGGERVLVPSYLPDAVVEPFKELGLRWEYYAIEPDLSPDVIDLERRIEPDTAAICSVNYFGFPQPGLHDIGDLADANDCYHVDDNAHSPVSVDDDTLLGTHGHIGLTTLWKTFPIPNGALLYITDDTIGDRFSPSELAGKSERIDVTDCTYVLKSLGSDVLNSNTRIRQSFDALVSPGSERSAPGNASDRYEQSKQRMSKLADRVLEEVDPIRIRNVRRENYRSWQGALAPLSGVELVFEHLPIGICPMVCPVRTPDAEDFLDELERLGVAGAYTWPRLSPDVRENPTYETANQLSSSVVLLPVHQQIDPESIEAIGDRLTW